ncbi:MAG: hypothetical protein ACREAX_02650 [Candidatus Nitrosotenuis sp.]
MKFLPVILFLCAAGLVPAYGQEAVNPSLIVQKVDIMAEDFNKVQQDADAIPFENTHAGTWQITIQNKLLYGNPDGDAIVRLYDANTANKFIEIGMSSPPERQFWIALNFPDIGYIPATRIDKSGWFEGINVILANNDAQGISISNGQRIVVSGVDLKEFVVGSYQVFGMREKTDPPAMNSGSLHIEVMSGDVSKNPFHYYPFYVTGVVGAIIGVLLVLKKRS